MGEVEDPSRASVSFQATYFDPEEKSYHRAELRETRSFRPGIETSSPRIEITPAALAALPLIGGPNARIANANLFIQDGDILTRQDGAVFRAVAPYVSAVGIVCVKLNRL